MAMTVCTECAAEISTTAKACPRCGAVIPRPKLWPWIVGVPVALFIALLLFGLSIPEYETRAREVRQVCEKLAAPDQQYICLQQYEVAIHKGRAASGD